MEDFSQKLSQYFEQAKESWAKISLNQKLIIAAVSLLLVILILTLALRSGPTPELQPLYTDLSEKDAAAIVEKLDELKINYQLANGSSTILVAEADKYKTRLSLASENLPRGEAGLEIFQESSFGETLTDKKVKYQAALQGELERTIRSLEKVQTARVHLVLPQETLFTDNEEIASASVAIKTRDGEVLSRKEINGIIHLIANSIERLEAKNIVIIDQNGSLISDDLENIDNSSELLKLQMNLKKQYEKDKQAAIQTMLDKTLGKDNAVVRVNVELNFDTRKETDEKYTHDPEGPFIRSENIIKESGEGTEGPPVGVPGVDENIPQFAEVETETGTSSYDRTDRTRNNELNRTETLTEFSIGDVRYDYLTVAVLVDNQAAEQSNLGADEQERIEKVRSIVATAAGLRENRQNENVNLEENISVAFMNFHTEPVPELKPLTALEKFLQWPFAPWLILILCIALGVSVFLLARKNKVIEEEEKLGFDTIIEEELRIEDLIDMNLTPEEKERQKIKQEIDKLVDDDSENAAQVIKTWLEEE